MPTNFQGLPYNRFDLIAKKKFGISWSKLAIIPILVLGTFTTVMTIGDTNKESFVDTNIESFVDNVYESCPQSAPKLEYIGPQEAELSDIAIMMSKIIVKLDKMESTTKSQGRLTRDLVKMKINEI
jgi:hypothetical protein